MPGAESPAEEESPARRPTPQTRPSPAGDVAIIGDVASLDAEACGLEWASHQRLWNEIARQVEADPADYSPSRAEDVLDRAGRVCGVTLRGQESRDKFIEAVRGTIGPVALRLAYGRAVEASGCALRLVGSGWAECGFDPGMVVAKPDRWSDWRRLYASARVVVIVPDDGQPSQELLDAAACGSAILVRAPRGTEGRGEPFSLREMFDFRNELATFSQPRELAAQITRLLSKEGERLALGHSARRRVEREHLYGHRFQTIVQTILTPTSMPVHQRKNR